MTFQDPRRLAITRRRFGSIDGPRPAATMPRARRIVLTGGPGSGKSTAASFLAREFQDDVWVLPEAATLLYKAGMPRGRDDKGIQIAQRAIFDVQRALEHAHGLEHPDRLQLCDRGTVDGGAYWPAGPEDFFRALQTDRNRELDRYDAVIFLHTAATLPAGYERDEEVRTEDREAAIDLDRRIYELYADHPRLIAIQSCGSFLEKLTFVRDAVERVLRGSGPAATPPGRSAAPSVPASSLANLASVGHLLPS